MTFSGNSFAVIPRPEPAFRIAMLLFANCINGAHRYPHTSVPPETPRFPALMTAGMRSARRSLQFPTGGTPNEHDQFYQVDLIVP